jgi:hypothetical protein
MIVYTAIYGGYDFLHPVVDVPGVTWRLLKAGGFTWCWGDHRSNE